MDFSYVVNLLNPTLGRDDFFLKPEDEIFILSKDDLNFLRSNYFINNIFLDNGFSSEDSARRAELFTNTREYIGAQEQ